MLKRLQSNANGDEHGQSPVGAACLNPDLKCKMITFKYAGCSEDLTLRDKRFVSCTHAHMQSRGACWSICTVLQPNLERKTLLLHVFELNDCPCQYGKIGRH